MEHESPEHYKKVRRKAILVRVFLVLLSWVVFYYAFFHMPILDNMQRAFGHKDCEAKGGTWVEHKNRCFQGVEPTQ